MGQVVFPKDRKPSFHLWKRHMISFLAIGTPIKIVGIRFYFFQSQTILLFLMAFPPPSCFIYGETHFNLLFVKI
jgi:hypothetical protein